MSTGYRVGGSQVIGKFNGSRSTIKYSSGQVVNIVAALMWPDLC